jgi:hypothetical protein
MEKADNVYVLPSSFGWSDLGTWNSAWENMEKDYFGNAVAGKWGLFRSNSQMQFTISPTTTTTVSTVFADSSLSTQMIGAYWDRSNMYIYQNGALMASTALSDTATALSNTNSNFIGVQNNATGNGPLAGSYLNGDIGEVVVLRSLSVFSELQRQKLEGSMAWRWGLQSNLPGGHPYKSARPTNSNLFDFQ